MTKYAIIYLYLQCSVKAISPCEKSGHAFKSNIYLLT